MAAGAAPIVPEAGLGVAAIATALGWGVLAVLLWSYRRSFGRLILYIANKLDAVAISIPHVRTLKPLAPVAAALRHVHEQIDHLLAEGMLACEKATVYLLQAMWHLLLWMARETADLAQTVEHALGLNRIADVPATVKALTAPLKMQLTILRRSVAAAERQADALFGRARRGIEHVEKIATKTIPRTIARVTSRIGTLERGVSSRAWWKRHLTGTLGIAAFSAIVATALGRLGLRWIRCGNVRKTGARLCGMDANLLEDLLAGTLAVTGSLSIVEYAKDLQTVMETATGLVSKVVREV